MTTASSRSSLIHLGPEFLGVPALISGPFNDRQERWSACHRGRRPCGALADAAKGAGARNAGVPMELEPRAYRLKASNAAPPISTSSGTIPRCPQVVWLPLPIAGVSLQRSPHQMIAAHYSSTSKGLTSRNSERIIGGKNASHRGYIGTFTIMRDCYRVALPSAPTLENVSSALKSQSPSNHVPISRHRPSRLARPAPVGFGHDMAMDWPRV